MNSILTPEIGPTETSPVVPPPEIAKLRPGFAMFSGWKLMFAPCIKLQYDLLPGCGQNLGLLVLTSVIPQLNADGACSLKFGVIAHVCLLHRRSGQPADVDLFVNCAGPGKNCLLVHLLEDLDLPDETCSAGQGMASISDE
jgi:hypothetical protein